MKEIKCIVVDDEFTSFDMIGGDLITFGAYEVFTDGTIGRKFYGECKPRSTKYFSEKAQEIHGISYFKATTFPDARETMIAFLQWLVPLKDQFPLIMGYWGAWAFDVRWLKYTMDNCGLSGSFSKAFKADEKEHLNVLALCKKNMAQVPVPNLGDDKKSRKGQYVLSNVAKYLGLELQHHSALSDAHVTAQILCMIIKGENCWTGELF